METMPSLPRIIALCGKKHSGKDVVAAYLGTRYGYVNAKFAAPLKLAVRGFFGFTEHQVEYDKETVDPFWDISPRQAMQFIGVDVVQRSFQTLIPGIGRDFFVKSLLARHAHDSKIVISDMRFLHEYHAIMQAGDCMVVKLTRPDLESEDQHCSETELENIEAAHVIVNNGTIDDLYDKVEKLVRESGQQKPTNQQSKP